MRAYLVPETGEVLYPVPVYADDGSLGDGLALAQPESDEAKRWSGSRYLLPMPERMRPQLERLRAARAQE